MPAAYTINDFRYKVVNGGKLQLLDCIGQGSFGAVFRARDLIHPESSLLAVKIIPKEEQLQLYRRELLLHGVVQSHPSVATIRRTFSDRYFTYLVLDYFPAGDLWRAIKEKKVFWGNDALVRSVFLQMIDAVAFCHEKGVYHRDLKPNNVLISPDSNRVWLTDFGLASTTQQNHAYGVGTQQYRSPECNDVLHDHRGYSAVRNDIWALAIVFVNVLTGVMPWAIANDEDGWYQCFVATPDFLRYTLPISAQAAHILQRMLTEREDDCASLAELRFLVAQADTFFMSDADIAAAEPHLQRVARNCRPAPRPKPAYVPIPSAQVSWGSVSSWARSPSILAETAQSPLEGRCAAPEPPTSTFVNSAALRSEFPDADADAVSPVVPAAPPAAASPAPTRPAAAHARRSTQRPPPAGEKGTSSATYVDSGEAAVVKAPVAQVLVATVPAPAVGGLGIPKRGHTYEGVYLGTPKVGVRQRLKRLFTHHA